MAGIELCMNESTWNRFTLMDLGIYDVQEHYSISSMAPVWSMGWNPPSAPTPGFMELHCWTLGSLHLAFDIKGW